MSQRPKSIPRELLFGNPEKASPKLSPDGRRMAYLAPDQGVLNIWLTDATGAAGKPVTQDRGRGIRNYFWAEDKRSLLYLQDTNGDENWHLYQTDIETLTTRDLTPFPEIQTQIIGTDPNFPHEVLVGMNIRDKRHHDAYRIDLRSGTSRLDTENPGDVIGWLADTEFKIRCAKAALPDGGTELRVRESETAPWRSFLRWSSEDQGGAHGFTPDNKGLYIESSHDSDTTGLWEYNLVSGAKRLIARSDSADLGHVMIHPKLYHAQAAAFEKDRLSWTVLDPELKDDFELLARSIDGDFSIVSRDDSDENWIVLYNRDLKPPSFHLYDRKNKRLKFLCSTRPKLDGYALSPMTPRKFKARDGLEIPVYLTLPAGVVDRPLPLVLLVHGGPWARDIWGYHPEVQWLANQGYGVLQVNFRGSLGFGKRFLHAGDREWGAKMQHDLTDAVAWAVTEGFADPKRTAIYGGSYGGYAALAGAAFTPDLYACAVDIVGPSNIATLVRSIPPYWEPLRKIFDLRVGNVDTEIDFLNERSPLFKAHQIRIPLLIAQGANDPRVKQAESEMIVKSLREKGKPVEYLLFEDEGHGFAKPGNRLKFYEKAEAFLTRHLERAEAPAR